MKIKFNNIIKVRKNNKDNKRNNKLDETKYEEIVKVNNNVENTNNCPVFKVYKKGGQIIKYDTNNINKNNDNGHIRTGAKLVIENFEKSNFDESTHHERIKRKKRQRTKSKIPKNSYLLFIFMILLAGASVMFAYKNYSLFNEESYAVYSSIDNNEESEKVNEQEQNPLSNNNDTKNAYEKINEETTKSNTKNVSMSNNKTNNKQISKVVPLDFAKPVNGEILKIYSKDKVIYSKTLELWKTHDGIDIRADENTIVKSIEKGTVEKIYEDSFYGKTIVIDHGQGYKSSYSNLADEVFVKEKQVITKLAKIGKVGKSAIGEIKDESHLHFSLIKNNEISDPTSIFR